MKIIHEFRVDNNDLQILLTDVTYEEAAAWLQSIGFEIVGRWAEGNNNFFGCMGTILWSRKFIYKNNTLYDWDYDRFDMSLFVAADR